MKNILIVVDVQNGFNRHEENHFEADKIVKLTQSGLFDFIIATRFLNKEGSPYTKFLDWHQLQTSPEIDLIKGINANLIVDKEIYTCVNENFLATLKEHNEGKMPHHIFICGVDTDCCVLKIATDLFENGIMPITLTHYCFSNGGMKSHLAGIEVMKRLIGKKCLVDKEITSKEDIEKIVQERNF